MRLAGDRFTVRRPSFIDKAMSRVKFFDSYANRHWVPALTDEQRQLIHALQREGCVVLNKFLPDSRLQQMQADLDRALQNLQFDMPCLAQSRIDEAQHAELIDNFMFGTPQQLAQWGVCFDRAEAT